MPSATQRWPGLYDQPADPCHWTPIDGIMCLVDTAGLIWQVAGDDGTTLTQQMAESTGSVMGGRETD